MLKIPELINLITLHKVTQSKTEMVY